MHGGVEPPLRRVEAETPNHLELERLLPFEREADTAHGPLPVGAGGRHKRHLLLLETVEHRAYLRRLHSRLEVVQEDVVRLVVVVEALDVAAPELEVLPQRRQELREIRLLARLHPHGHRERGRTRHLGTQVGRNTTRLLPVAADDTDQAGLVRVVLQRLLEWRELLEESADLVGGERLVRDPPDRGQLLGADGAAARRHLHLLIPAEQRRRAIEILDLGDALLQFRHGLHRREPYRRDRRRSRRCQLGESFTFLFVTPLTSEALSPSLDRGGSVLVRRRIQTPSAVGTRARFCGGGGRPRSSPSGPPY